MAKTYNLSVATGKYHNAAGEEKTNWKNIGGIFETPTGQTDENGNDVMNRFILMDRTFNPAGVPDLDKNGAYRGGDSILISIFKVDEKENNQ